MSGVDVIIPCYRYGHLLRQAVRSVLDEQPGVDVRVLIIDDCSPDHTEAVSRSLVAQDGRIEYRRHQSNQGHLPTFNEGLAWARADYTMLLSADDVATPGALCRAASLMDSNPNVGLVWGRAIKFQGDAPPTSSESCGEAFATNVQPGIDFIRQACESGDNIVFTPTVIVRSALQDELGGYRDHLTHAGDFEMWMRFAAHSDVGYIDGPQAWYRVHGQNMSSSYSLARDIEQRKLAFDDVFAKHGRHIEGAGQLHEMAMRSLAQTAFWAGSHHFDAHEVEACRSFHELAVRVDPSFRRSMSWRRFTLKNAMGPAIWSAVRGLLWRVRRKAA